MNESSSDACVYKTQHVGKNHTSCPCLRRGMIPASPGEDGRRSENKERSFTIVLSYLVLNHKPVLRLTCLQFPNWFSLTVHLKHRPQCVDCHDVAEFSLWPCRFWWYRGMQTGLITPEICTGIRDRTIGTGDIIQIISFRSA